jgi:3-hydroxybutyryl-CoA dehydratase
MLNFLDGLDIQDIKVGMKASYSQTITDADIKTFAGISGDNNPVHLDEEYAKNSRFRRRISHGMLLASYFSGLFGTKIPGKGAIYVSQNLEFRRPVYLGDTVHAIVIVNSIDIVARKVIFQTICKVKNKIVIDGEAKIYIPKKRVNL